MCNIMDVTRLNRSWQDWLLIVGISQIVLVSGREGENDQPKIERLVNNDARLILRGKLNETTTR